MSKKIILASLVAGMAASSALAVEKNATVTVGGSLDTQLGFRNEKGADKFVKGLAANGKRHTSTIVNDTRVHVAVDGKAHGMSYGGKIVLNADTSENKFGTQEGVGYATVAYAESGFGRVEAGNTTSVYNAMSVSAANVAHATGGASAGDAQYWVNPTSKTDFIRHEGLFSNQQTGGTDHAAKVNYFTPTYAGFKAGVSFTPDMELKGTASSTHTVSSQFVSLADNSVTNAFKNVVTGAATYEGKSNHATFKASVTGERGVAKKDATTAAVSYKNLNSIQGGLQVSYQGFSVAGSYANLGKSGQNKAALNKASNYWTAGVAYDHNRFGASVSYFDAKKATRVGTAKKYNKTANWSVGADYKLAPGFLPYVEYTNFNYKFADTTKAKSKGNVVLAGTKLQF